MAWVATAIIGAGVVGAAGTAYAASKASDAQQQATATAANTQLAMYHETNANLAPFRNIGGVATDQMTKQLPDLTKPISVNPQDFINSDMYNFLQTQGERAVANSAAARGLGTSGAALKGSAAFESGLNAQQYQQNFNNQVTNQTNAYNRLKGLIDTGENAAAQTGNAATATGQGVAASQTAGGNAAAAGYNAIGAAGSNAANSFITAGLYGNGNTARYLSPGSSIPGAVGPTSVGGLPLA